MFAVLAAIAFAIGLILHLVGHGTAAYVITAWLAGLFALALHFALGAAPVMTWPRRPPPA